MSEENQSSETAEDQVVTEAEVQPEQQPENQEPVQVESKTEDHNWSQVRGVLQTQKSEIDELKRQVAEKPEVDEFAGVDPEEYVTFGQHQKLSQKNSQKESKEIADLKEQLMLMKSETRENIARDKHDDYDYVIQNFGLPLVHNNPRLKAALKVCDDWAEMAYNMAKATPEYQKSLTQNSPKAEKVQKNIERPTSANAAGSSLKNQTSYFADMSKAEVWKQSQEFARRA